MLPIHWRECIFLMNDGRVHTPTADCFLNGITRQTVMKMIEGMGYEVVERTSSLRSLKMSPNAS